MEVELEPRVKSLPFKVKGMSRESPLQKASHVLDSDLRNHWSTGTNTKEWILLELDEPCLLSHIRIYNKSVLEWEISAGLRYKVTVSESAGFLRRLIFLRTSVDGIGDGGRWFAESLIIVTVLSEGTFSQKIYWMPETFPKVRPRCEAPRRDMMYPMNYTPCRYVRISCLRGSPIAIFFVQLIGITVTGLEPEFQPIINYLLPHIISSKQDGNDMHLQLLQDITNRLGVFLPQLEADLNSFSDAAEYATRFLAMLAGPLYPILQIVKERETARSVGNISESEASRNSQPVIALTVSSNFEPRRSRIMSSLIFPTSCYLAFRPDAIFILLRKAYKDSNLGNICRVASWILWKFLEPIKPPEASHSCSEITTSVPDEGSQSEPSAPPSFADYSDLFGDDFKIPEYMWDSIFSNVLDIGLVEEGILHVLYACVSQPLLCSKLADNASDFWLALPLVQALLPALRPSINSSDLIDEDLSLWKQPFVQKALSQIVGTSSSSVYRPLLRACAGYLSSFSPSNGRAACVLIDLCSGVLAPWMPQVIAKIDLALELLEDLLPVIQGAHHSFARARAALKYIVLALSGVMDDILVKYKDAKHQVLFLVEMLEPYLDPALTPVQSIIAFVKELPGILNSVC
uniref:DNA-repair protein Xrcc1 N-terminal domain-containing protein n=1 Tax=Solanum lycopersicum TaxID=4081 RepID=A0A3Q7F241_SOLLC